MNSVSIAWGEYVRLMLVLCGILALAVLAIRFWLPKLSIWNRPAAGPIEICARLPLEPRRTLYIVKAANTYMLLASSEAGVQHLKSLSAEEWSGLQAKGEAPAAR
jgi:flagellar protein FliO/FliZ